MAEKHVLLTQLGRFYTNIKNKFVVKENKTGSETEFKVLSDNNLTDALVEKIQTAGTSNFDGTYTALTDKPSINGVEIDGAKTLDDLSLMNASAITTAIGDATKDLATTESVTSAVGDAKTELEGKINAAVSSAYKVKGSTAFVDLPTPAKAEEGNVYNVSDAFTTTDAFEDGANIKLPAGTNVVCVKVGSSYKWDALAGFVDTSDFVKTADLEYATDADIDALFVA